MQYTKKSKNINTKEVRFIKKLIGTVLAAAIILCSLTAGSVMAFASTGGVTQSSAVNWIKDKGNSSWWEDVDGVYDCQCVDLIKAYYSYLGQPWATANAYEYCSISLPSGWSRNSTPSAGSIVVWNQYVNTGAWTTGWTGHVGLVYSVSGSTIYTVETNLTTDGSGNRGAANAKFSSHPSSSASCYIHPDFAQDTFTFDVNAYLDGAANNNGVSGLTFDVYINGSKVVNDVTDFCNSYSKGTSYKVDDIKTTGALIYTGSSSFSGTINSSVEVKLPVKTGLTVKSSSSGTYRVTIPSKYNLNIYTSATANSSEYHNPPRDYSYTYTCDAKYTLSDGTVRYSYLCTDGKHYFFKYDASYMKVTVPLTVKSKTTGLYKVTIPANYKLDLYESAADSSYKYYASARSSSYVQLCADKYVMSDGSIRYGYYFSSQDYRCFDFTSQMKAEQISLKSSESGTYKVSIPSGYELHLYTSGTAPYTEYLIKASDSAYTRKCDKKYTFTDGSVRFGYSSSGKYYFFDYVSGMTVVKPLTVVSTTTGTFSITVPANHALPVYSSATSYADEQILTIHNGARTTYKCSAKYVLSDGSVRYKYLTDNGEERYFTFTSNMLLFEGCTHTYTNDSTKLAKEATCTSPAYYYKRCSKCGDYSTETFAKGNALGHSFAATGNKLTKEATCTTAPQYYKRCTRCDMYSTATFTSGIPKGHVVVIDAAVPATCTQIGKTEGSHCSVCNAIITAQQETPMIDHIDKDSNGKCDLCSLLLSTSNQPGEGEEDTDSSESSDCSCLCHTNGQMGTIWKILMFICRILGLNEFKYCECGKCHF